MLQCCAFIPMALIMIAAPIMAAGRGRRPFVLICVVEVVLLALLGISAFSATVVNPGSGLGQMLFLGIIAFVGLPMMMGGIVLYAKHAEQQHAGNFCRLCGYDLRATPERCPECGTPVRGDPNQF